MSAVAQLRNRTGRPAKQPEAYGRTNHSYNARIHGYTNGIPKVSRHSKPRKPKAKYSNVQSKYSSVFSKYLHEPSYPPSIKVKKNVSVPTKNGGQDRLINRIFGNENNFKMIKSLMNNANPQNSQPPIK